MKKSILILLSSYCGEKYIKEQVFSLEKQLNVYVTILIRDDGSKDGTVEIIKQLQQEFSNIILIEGKNIGCAKSFSELLIRASKDYSDYDFFAFCDQDDFWLPEKLFRAVSVLEKMPKEEQLLYCSNLWVVDKNLQNRKKKYPDNYVKITSAGSLAESYGTGCTMVFNKEVIDFYSTHIPKNLHLHDLWIYHQCVFLGQVYYDNESYILYRQHGNNVVGARTDFSTNLKSKINSLKKLKTQHYREVEAKEILNIYGDILADENKKNIELVSNYSKSFSYMLKLLFSYKIRRRKRIDNLLFKIRIILKAI